MYVCYLCVNVVSFSHLNCFHLATDTRDSIPSETVPLKGQKCNLIRSFNEEKRNRDKRTNEIKGKKEGHK
jgi:hypothetical protein